MVIKSDKTLSPFAAPAEARSKWRQALPQILAVCVKNVLLLGFGMTLGFPTILIPSLSSNKPDEIFHLGQEAISWIGSINLICVPVGCILSGVITQPIGRKRSMQLVNIPFVIAWLLFYFSKSVWQVFLALAITGLTGGLLEAPTLTYVAEITQPSLRGVLSSTAAIGVIAGILIEFFLGTFFSWQNVALISCFAPILAFVLLLFLPESPHWLTYKKRDDEAKRSLAWFRGWVPIEEVEQEFNDIRDHINETPDNHSLIDICKLFAKKNFLIPHMIVSYAFFLSQMNGTTTLQTYAVKVFHALRSPINEYYATIAFGISEFCGAAFCTGFVFYFGKRRITFISLLGCSLCFSTIATRAYLNHIYDLNEHVYEDQNSRDWISSSLLIAVTFFSHMGIKLLPWLLIGEVYPNEIRAHATGIAGAVGYVFAFISNKTFFWLINSITLPGTFWFFSGICFSGLIVLFFILPETEGRTLFEITEHFANHKFGGKISKTNTKNVKAEINQAYNETEDTTL